MLEELEDSGVAVLRRISQGIAKDDSTLALQQGARLLGQELNNSSVPQESSNLQRNKSLSHTSESA